MADGPAVGGEQSGRDIFKAFLAQYGLSALADDDALWNSSKAKETAEWMIDIEKTPTYQTRFKGIVELKAKAARGEYVPYIPSVSEYIELEEGYRQKAKEYELPATMYDSPDDFHKLISGSVSVSEYNTRLKMAQQTALGDDPLFREELARLVPGANIGDLTAYYLDPDRGDVVLQERYNQAQFGAAARRSNFGLLSQKEIETLQGKVTLEQAQAGFDTLSAGSEITGALPGEEEGGMGREAQLRLVAGEGMAQQEFKKRQAQRKAVFEGGGGYDADAKGVGGLGGE